MDKEFYNLSTPQKTIWFTEEFYKGTTMENIVGTTMVYDKIDFPKFEKAINIFIEKNDSFRLKFIINNGKVQQFVESFTKFDFDCIDVLSEKDVKKLEKAVANTPFETLNSFLFTFKLFKFPDGHGGFVINMHHLISDAWTSGIVSSKIIDFYDALVNNEEISEEKSPSYIDYIVSEQNYFKSQKYDKDKAFWEDQFRTIPDSATIPSFMNDESEVSTIAKRKQFVLPAELMGEINNFCSKNKISVFNFFMGVLSLYISNVTSLDDFVIGTPVLNRSNIREKHTSGMFINVIPFRVSVDYTKNFAEFCSQISAHFFNIFKHQRYSYQLILENLRKKNKNVPGLFNVMLSYQNMRNNKQTAKTNFDSSWIFANHISEDIDIHLYDINNTGNIVMAYDYRTQKYSVEDIFALHSRLLNITNQILENNEILLKDIEIVTPDEKNEILYKFNNTYADYQKNKTIIELFEEQVEKTPDNIALVFEDNKLTYSQLNQRANSLANYLRKNGIRNNDIVGIMLNRSLEMIISILAILKAGGTYVPIDPTYPQDRILYMLKNSSAKILLTFSALKDNINFDNKICVELTNEKLYSSYTNNLENINSPEDSAYMIYTSGSTGLPKGVVLTHKALSNLAAYSNNYIKYLKNNKYRTVVSITTVSFDIFIFETLISLQKGLRLVIANENEQTIPRLLNQLLEKYNVEIIQSTPSRMQLFINNISEIPSLKNLKFITLAGEQLPLSLAQKLYEISDATIYNGYGPSETTVFSTLTDMENHSNITIGKPLFNTQIYILGNNFCLLPIGIPGEIYISGDGLGKGYLNNNELTKKAFVPNPFNSNTLMYKTGDFGYYREDGEIVCLGRVDSQVKIRGLRIEPGEIENKILKNKSVTSCVVIKKIDNNSHEFLCAYFTENSPVDISELRSSLKESLPHYMVPQYFTKLDAIPFTPNGKVDKKRLPEPNLVSNVPSAPVSSRNSTDIELVKILQSLLNVKEINIEDNFFELGGDSLSAINLCMEIFNKFNIQITVKDILSNPIIRNISDLIRQNTSNEDSHLIPKVKSNSVYPVSSAQKRMYFSSKIAGNDSILYNIAGGVILDGTLDAQKLNQCFNILVNRHESFRTYFALQSDTIVQKIMDKVDFNLEINENLVSLENMEDAFKSFVKPFDLSKAPLIRANLSYLANNKTLLMVDMHHIISDGTSLSIFTDELCKLYNGETLPELNISYKDFSSFERSELENDKLKSAEEYWVNQFKDGIPVLNMPTNYSRSNSKSYEGAKLYSSLDEKTTANINSLCKELNVTPYMLLLSVFYILLYKYTSQEDIVIGTPVAGREYKEIMNVIGMFVNTLPLRNYVHSSSTFKEFLHDVKRNILEAFNHQSYPFDKLVNKLNINNGNTDRNPLFDVMFIYQNTKNAAINFDGTTGKYYYPDSHIAKFDLSLEVIPTENTFDLSFEYSTKLFKKDFIGSLSHHFINILNAILANKEISIAKIDMLTDIEKNQILNEINNTNMDYPKNKTIVQLFEEQVDKNPNNIAITFEGENLSYFDLNENANNLANYLRSQGIKKNDIIGIMLVRSFDLIINILGVLKAGASYMLIDHNLPEDRIEYMLNNANATLLIADSRLKDFKYKNMLFIDKITLPINTINPNINIDNSTNLSVVYTSGSTGNPKGVLIKMQSMVNLIYCYKNYLDADSFSNFLSICSLSFDMFAVEIFVPLVLGKHLILANEDEQKNPITMAQLIEQNNAEYMLITPSKMSLLLMNDVTTNCLSKLKSIQIGGESLKASMINKLNKYTAATIYDAYGPTEITSCCSIKKLTSANNITIGKPLGNIQMYILNSDMNLCPCGVIGEICVAGDGISRGYVNDLFKTQSVFIQNPFGPGLLYKTGDFGFYDKNYEINFVGRNDSQIKIRGLRIELSEIENSLLAIPDVDSCVVLYNNANENSFLSAFFTASTTVSVSAIREDLSKYLPSYMIPKYFVQLDKLPVTVNGKLDTIFLQNYEFSKTITNYSAPETELQKIFCAVWEELLNTTVGIDDNIFELGADSLLAIKFKVELMSKNIDIPYEDIFKYKTIRLLSNTQKTNLETKIFDTFDYTDINNILAKNSFEGNNLEINKNNNNNIILLGSTGFVGMHILYSFIKKDLGNIYCIVRSKSNTSAQKRFINILHYYFGTELDNFLDNRIFVFEGDITSNNFGLSIQDFEFLAHNTSAVINSAANVKHYGDFEEFKSINISATEQLISFCKKYNKRLLHLSTLSISGKELLGNEHSHNKATDIDKIDFSETNLYIGQKLNNIYTRSKFEAEKIILNNIEFGLNAQILRLGNITSRYSDGKFQKNGNENAFVNRIKSYIALGNIPNNLLDLHLEFTPVDYCADAIITILENYCKKISVCHIYNHNHIKISAFLRYLQKSNIDLKVISINDFNQLISNTLSNEKNKIEGLINDFDIKKNIVYNSNIKISSNFSVKFLESIGFSWPIINEDYITKYINFLKKNMLI